MRIFFQVVKLYFDCFYNWEQKKDLSLLLRVHQWIEDGLLILIQYNTRLTQTYLYLGKDKS